MALPINISELLNGNTIEWDRLEFKANYRNRRIGDFLKEIHLTEGRSTGIPTIYKQMKQNGSPAPVFETDDENNYFLTVLRVHPLSRKRKKSKKKKNEPVNEPVNNRQKEILKLIKHNKYVSIVELSKEKKVGRETIKRDLKRLKELKLIKRVGGDKTGFWEII